MNKCQKYVRREMVIVTLVFIIFSSRICAFVYSILGCWFSYIYSRKLNLTCFCSFHVWGCEMKFPHMLLSIVCNSNCFRYLIFLVQRRNEKNQGQDKMHISRRPVQKKICMGSCWHWAWFIPQQQSNCLSGGIILWDIFLHGCFRLV